MDSLDFHGFSKVFWLLYNWFGSHHDLANICREREYWGIHLYLLIRLFLANKSPGQFEKAQCSAGLSSQNSNRTQQARPKRLYRWSSISNLAARQVLAPNSQFHSLRCRKTAGQCHSSSSTFEPSSIPEVVAALAAAFPKAPQMHRNIQLHSAKNSPVQTLRNN